MDSRDKEVWEQRSKYFRRGLSDQAKGQSRGFEDRMGMNDLIFEHWTSKMPETPFKKMLTFQYDRWKTMQHRMFEDQQEQQSRLAEDEEERQKKIFENNTDRRKSELINSRKGQLNQQAGGQLAKARGFYGTGEYDKGAKWMQRYRDTHQDVYDLEMEQSNLGHDWKVQDSYVQKAMATQAKVQANFDEEDSLAENAGQKHGNQLSILQQMQQAAEGLKAAFETTEFIKQADIEKANALLGFFEKIEAAVTRINAQSGAQTPFQGAGGMPGAPNMPGVPMRAAGGPVSRNSTYLVGERGPELFTPTLTGKIFSKADTQRIAANAIGQPTGGSSVMVQNHSQQIGQVKINANAMDVEKFQRDMNRQKRSDLARRGGLN